MTEDITDYPADTVRDYWEERWIKQGLSGKDDHAASLVGLLSKLWPGLPLPVAEYQFHPDRKWRFDLAWPHYKIAIEIHGANWVRGKHVRGDGFAKDREKMNSAQVRKWTVLEFTTDWLDFANAPANSDDWYANNVKIRKSNIGKCLALIEEAFNMRGLYTRELKRARD